MASTPSKNRTNSVGKSDKPSPKRSPDSQPKALKPIKPKGSMGMDLLLIAIGTSLIGLGILGYLFYQELLSSSKREVDRSAEAQSRQIESKFANVRETVDGIAMSARTLSRQQPKSKTGEAYQKLIVEGLQRSESIAGIGIAQNENMLFPAAKPSVPYVWKEQSGLKLPISGQPISASSASNKLLSGNRPEILNIPFYKENITKGKALWTEPYTSLGKTIITYSVPISDGQKTLGVVNADAIASNLFPVAASTPSSNSEIGYVVVNATGKVITSSEQFQSQNPAVTESLNNLVQQSKTQPAGIAQSGGNLWAYRKIEGSDWLMITALPEAAITNKLIVLVGGTALGISAILAIAILGFVNSLKKRLNLLTEECDRFLTQQGNLDIVPAGKDEIEQLSLSLKSTLQQAKANDVRMRSAVAQAADSEDTSAAQIQQTFAETQLMETEVGDLLDVVSSMEEGDLTIEAQVNDRATGSLLSSPTESNQEDTSDKLVVAVPVITVAAATATFAQVEHAEQDLSIEEYPDSNIDNLDVDDLDIDDLDDDYLGDLEDNNLIAQDSGENLLEENLPNQLEENSNSLFSLDLESDQDQDFVPAPDILVSEDEAADAFYLVSENEAADAFYSSVSDDEDLTAISVSEESLLGGLLQEVYDDSAFDYTDKSPQDVEDELIISTEPILENRLDGVYEPAIAEDYSDPMSDPMIDLATSSFVEDTTFGNPAPLSEADLADLPTYLDFSIPDLDENEEFEIPKTIIESTLDNSNSFFDAGSIPQSEANQSDTDFDSLYADQALVESSEYILENNILESPSLEENLPENLVSNEIDDYNNYVFDESFNESLEKSLESLSNEAFNNTFDEPPFDKVLDEELNNPPNDFVDTSLEELTYAQSSRQDPNNVFALNSSIDLPSNTLDFQEDLADLPNQVSNTYLDEAMDESLPESFDFQLEDITTVGDPNLGEFSNPVDFNLIQDNEEFADPFDFNANIEIDDSIDSGFAIAPESEIQETFMSDRSEQTETSFSSIFDESIEIDEVKDESDHSIWQSEAIASDPFTADPSNLADAEEDLPQSETSFPSIFDQSLEDDSDHSAWQLEAIASDPFTSNSSNLVDTEEDLSQPETSFPSIFDESLESDELRDELDDLGWQSEAIATDLSDSDISNLADAEEDLPHAETNFPSIFDEGLESDELQDELDDLGWQSEAIASDPFTADPSNLVDTEENLHQAETSFPSIFDEGLESDELQDELDDLGWQSEAIASDPFTADPSNLVDTEENLHQAETSFPSIFDESLEGDELRDELDDLGWQSEAVSADLSDSDISNLADTEESLPQAETSFPSVFDESLEGDELRDELDDLGWQSEAIASDPFTSNLSNLSNLVDTEEGLPQPEMSFSSIFDESVEIDELEDESDDSIWQSEAIATDLSDSDISNLADAEEDLPQAGTLDFTDNLDSDFDVPEVLKIQETDNALLDEAFDLDLSDDFSSLSDSLDLEQETLVPVDGLTSDEEADISSIFNLNDSLDDESELAFDELLTVPDENGLDIVEGFPNIEGFVEEIASDRGLGDFTETLESTGSNPMDDALAFEESAIFEELLNTPDPQFSIDSLNSTASEINNVELASEFTELGAEPSLDFSDAWLEEISIDDDINMEDFDELSVGYPSMDDIPSDLSTDSSYGFADNLLDSLMDEEEPVDLSMDLQNLSESDWSATSDSEIVNPEDADTKSEGESEFDFSAFDNSLDDLDESVVTARNEIEDFLSGALDIEELVDDSPKSEEESSSLKTQDNQPKTDNSISKGKA